MKMVRTLSALLALSLTSAALGQMPVPTPAAAPAEPNAIPLYGDKTPGSTSTEIWSLNGTWLGVRNVTRPTLTPVLPNPKKATGAAVIVAPGGAFMLLAMGHEGWNVAKALADRGIAAFVLKYRLRTMPRPCAS
jgi:acetyl esterase/lipase